MASKRHVFATTTGGSFRGVSSIPSLRRRGGPISHTRTRLGFKSLDHGSPSDLKPKMTVPAGDSGNLTDGLTAASQQPQRPLSMEEVK
jgi:hypothetical protein